VAAISIFGTCRFHAMTAVPCLDYSHEFHAAMVPLPLCRAALPHHTVLC